MKKLNSNDMNHISTFQDSLFDEADKIWASGKFWIPEDVARKIVEKVYEFVGDILIEKMIGE